MPKKVLVGILDWGLGHASRCIPLLRYLLQLECQIFIAATGGQRILLEGEIPAARFLSPPPYAVNYQGKGLILSLIRQMPRLLRVIQAEQRWLEEMHRQYDFDLVISDNRYGLFLKNVPSVILTHQLVPNAGSIPIPKTWLRQMHYRFLNQFTEVWVPDVEESPGLAGELSHPTKLPKGCRYIGPISRVEPPTVREQQHLLLLISGPEPTRTQFEHMLQKQLDTYPGAWKLVRGVPGGDADAAHGIYAHLNAADLSMLLSRTSLVICRPGYTSVMDLLRLGQKALLVPTPGQTEQEYLAVHLERSGYFPYLSQEEFTLNAALEKAKQFPYAWPELDFEAYRKVLEEFVKYRC